MKLRAAFLMIIFLCSCVLFAAAADEVKGPKLPEQKIKPGTLSGSVADNKGTRLEGKKVEIVNADGKVVAEALSDKNGLYRIKGLPEGDYTMRVDGKPVCRLSVTKTALVSTLSVALPASAALLPLSWTLIGVGGTALAVGVPVMASSGGGGGSSSSHHPPPPDPVSP